MKFRFSHNCLYVLDMERALAFYKKALGLEPIRWMYPEDRDVELAFLSDGVSAHELEIACLAGRTEPYDPGDSHFHTAFAVADIDAAKALHTEMGCICHDDPAVPVYFIRDPDGYEFEIIPAAPPLSYKERRKH